MKQELLNGRRSGGFSLRTSLADQGVTCETAMRAHLAMVHQTLQVSPTADITRFRVNPSNPNLLDMG